FSGSSDSPASGTRRILHDSGLLDTYTWNGTVWVAPAGVHDKLVADGAGWKLIHKDQSYRKFGSDGTLTAIGDQMGLEIQVSYSTASANKRINTATDPSGRVVTFGWDGSDATKLVSITAPLAGTSTRIWSFS